MTDQPLLPEIINPIPPLVANEGGTFGPFDLLDYLKPATSGSGDLVFVAGLENGDGLPQGLMCTTDGFITGFPAIGTAGHYTILLQVSDALKATITINLSLTINERPHVDEFNSVNKMKAQVWEALGKDLPLPEFADILNRPITVEEIYYLLQRYAVFTIWDVYNLEPMSEKQIITLTGCSPHYVIYDRGSCVTAAPKDLFSHERTLEDALQTARVLAREVHKRGWTIEFAGFNKMIRAAWVELQVLGRTTGKSLEILHYSPSPDEEKLATLKMQAQGINSPSPE